MVWDGTTAQAPRENARIMAIGSQYGASASAPTARRSGPSCEARTAGCSVAILSLLNRSFFGCKLSRILCAMILACRRRNPPVSPPSFRRCTSSTNSPLKQTGRRRHCRALAQARAQVCERSVKPNLFSVNKKDEIILCSHALCCPARPQRVNLPGVRHL